MDLASMLRTVRTGFTRSFWVANTLELFERFAYYGSKAVLAVFVADYVGLGPESAGWLVGSVFNTLLYFLPILAGTVVDRFGFRRSLQACFGIFCVGYLLIGLGGMPAAKPFVTAVGGVALAAGGPVVSLFGWVWSGLVAGGCQVLALAGYPCAAPGAAPPLSTEGAYMVVALIVTAIGGSLIKPCIVGTVARTTTEQTKSLGYSIYYMLVNFGGAVGPLLALQVRENVGIAYVLVMSSLTTLALLVGTTLFFGEPERPADAPPQSSMAKVLASMAMVFTNLRFMGFLVIFSGFWAMFWQIFYSLPFYVRDFLKYERFEVIETVDAWMIIVVTVPATALAKRLRPILAMAMGFALASASWFLMAAFPSTPMTVLAIALFAVGEATQAPRYYEYVAELAPKEQMGTYMGFAFLPVAIGTFAAGIMAGKLVAHYLPKGASPEMLQQAPHMWYWVGAVGVVATLLMLAYDRFVAPHHEAA